ncbi:hypothetical protein ACOMHN_027236 [Nucella lapillus]
MYPSRWTLTQLSTALHVPLHNLRNRRWRFRKAEGLKGDLRTRGSRTMLPDKERVERGHRGRAKRGHGGRTPARLGVHPGAVNNQPVSSADWWKWTCDITERPSFTPAGEVTCCPGDCDLPNQPCLRSVQPRLPRANTLPPPQQPGPPSSRGLALELVHIVCKLELVP